MLRKLESAATGQVLLANLKQQAAQVNQLSEMLQFYMARNDEHSENVRAETRAHEVDNGSSSSAPSAASGSIASTRHLIPSLHGRVPQDLRAEGRTGLDDGPLGGSATNAGPDARPSGRSAEPRGPEVPPQVGVAMTATEQQGE